MDFEALTQAEIGEHRAAGTNFCVPGLTRRSHGRYQVAYGHRRLKAATELGRPVRAVVRTLSDAELVIAQGKENNERRDLSFIERALFAAHLEHRKFERPTIQAALGVDKPELSPGLFPSQQPSRLTSSARSDRRRKSGRPRWLALAERVTQTDAARKIEAVQRSEAFQIADSDGRFHLVFAALQPHRSAPAVETYKSANGRTLARVERTDKGLRLSTDVPAFRQFLESRLSELLKEFEALGLKKPDHSKEGGAGRGD